MENIEFVTTEIDIIKKLFQKKATYISSKELAAEIGVSDKTVRKYINHAKEALEQYGATIEMKKGSGYLLNIEDQHTFYSLLEEINSPQLSTAISSGPSDNIERERFILNLLLLENKQVTIHELAETMFISKSTVSAVIQQIKHKINAFNLTLNYDYQGNLLILGEELEKRRFILSYFYSNRSIESLNTTLFDYQFEGFSMETIFIIVLEKCREYQVQVSDFVLQNLVIHISLAIKRIESGFVINPKDEISSTDIEKELFVAEKIVASIEELIGIEFPENEAFYIAVHLKSKSNQLGEDTKFEDKELQIQLLEKLEQLNTVVDTPFLIDQQLLMGLKIHFEPLMTRLKNHIALSNPLTEEVVTKFPKLFAKSKQVLATMPILKHYEVSDHEWSYILLHILAAVERYKLASKLKVIVICATGLGSAQMLKNRLENEFSNSLSIESVISYYQLNGEMLKDIDLIISTIDISTTFYSVPVVNVSVFLNKEDIDLINKYVGRDRSSQVKKNKLHINQRKSQDIFNQYFSTDRFIQFEPGTSRDEMMQQLIATLSDSSTSVFVGELEKQIQIREQFSSLAFSQLAAFPHPAQPVGISSEIAIGLLPSGLYWDADHPKIKIVFLMSHSSIENPGLEMINEGLAAFIHQEDLMYQLILQPSFEQFKTLFMHVLG